MNFQEHANGNERPSIKSCHLRACTQALQSQLVFFEEICLCFEQVNFRILNHKKKERSNNKIKRKLGESYKGKTI